MRKSVALFIFSVLLMSFSVLGLERAKSIPLKELQNKSGPLFVPIPYPKTNEELLVDLKYYIKNTIHIKNRYRAEWGEGEDLDFFVKHLNAFVATNTGFIVADIVKVYNFDCRRPYPFSYIVDLEKPGMGIMLRFILADAGYWLSTGFVTDKRKLMKPIRSVLLDNQKLKELLAEGLVTKDAVEGSIAVFYLYMNDIEKPYYKIIGVNGQVYLVGDRGSLFTVENEEPIVELEKYNDRFKVVSNIMMQINEKIKDKRQDQYLCVDTISDKYIYVKKIK